MKKKVIADINITPFVDVLLVVLIIFMVSAPMLNNGYDVNLPKSGKNNVSNSQESTIVISVTNRGEIFFNEKKSNLYNIKIFLKEYNQDKTKIFIKGDKDVSYKNIINVMNLIQSSGFKQVSLITKIN